MESCDLYILPKLLNPRLSTDLNFEITASNTLPNVQTTRDLITLQSGFSCRTIPAILSVLLTNINCNQFARFPPKWTTLVCSGFSSGLHLLHHFVLYNLYFVEIIHIKIIQITTCKIENYKMHDRPINIFNI